MHLVVVSAAIVVLTGLAFVTGTEFTHDHKRIGPIDLVSAEHSCLEKFKVRENSIIRTEDSRKLGAKFLNESDVGNREDCFNLCCNTRYCNVAVFEENTPFSCYMFDCGDTDDFRCRFTTHSYYTSAMINRHQLDLGMWTSQRKHESELANLRSMNEVPSFMQSEDTSTQSNQSQTSTIHTTSTTTQAPSTIKTSTPKVARRCSRFQFECHSGECIAIYNACDGIPQCSDGSDEGPDLDCPQVAQSSSYGATSVSPNGNRHLSKQAWDLHNQQTRQYESPVFNHRNTILDYNRVPNGASSDYTRDELGGFPVHSKNPGYYDYGQKPSWSNIAERYQGQGTQPDSRRDSSSIYRHDYQDYSYLHQPPISKQQNLPLQTKQAGINKQKYLTRPNGRVWQADKPQYVPFSGQDFLPLQKQIQTNSAPIQNEQTGLIYPKENIPQNIQENVKPFVNSQPAYHQMVGKVLDPSSLVDSSLDSSPTESNREITSTKSEKVIAHVNTMGDNISSVNSTTGKVTIPQKEIVSRKQNSEIQSHISVSKYQIDISELDFKDKESHAQASGAVLALSLGVCITALLVLLVGCRMKSGKRRIPRQRGRRSKLEHDADYLVNGMYL